MDKKKPGERFGKLVPYYYTILHGKVYWNCVCDCSHNILVSTSNLKNKIVTKCNHCRG